MIFQFNKGKENTFIFQAYSYKSAEAWLLANIKGLSSNPDDGSDWVGNYISLIATQDDNPPFRPLFFVKNPYQLMQMPGTEGNWGEKHWGK